MKHYVVAIPSEKSAEILMRISQRMQHTIPDIRSRIIEPHFTLCYFECRSGDDERLCVEQLRQYSMTCRRFSVNINRPYYYGNAKSGNYGLGLLVRKTGVLRQIVAGIGDRLAKLNIDIESVDDWNPHISCVYPLSYQAKLEELAEVLDDEMHAMRLDISALRLTSRIDAGNRLLSEWSLSSCNMLSSVTNSVARFKRSLS